MRTALLFATLFMVPAAATDWSGLYAGVHAGYAARSYEVDGRSSGPGFSSNFAYRNEANGVIGGAQLGYLHQLGSVIAGIEADFSFGHADDVIGPIIGDGMTLDSASFKTEWVASVRAKAGYALDEGVFFYVTAGAGFSHWTEQTGVSGGINPEFGTRRTGWVAGLGAAFDLGGDWFGVLEYAHYDFGRIERIDLPLAEISNAQARIDIAKLALNYRF